MIRPFCGPKTWQRRRASSAWHRISRQTKAAPILPIRTLGSIAIGHRIKRPLIHPVGLDTGQHLVCHIAGHRSSGKFSAGLPLGTPGTPRRCAFAKSHINASRLRDFFFLGLAWADLHFLESIWFGWLKNPAIRDSLLGYLPHLLHVGRL